MARNGSGTYAKVGGDAVFDTVISETYFNAQIDDMVTALTGSVAADGQTPVTGNIAMGTNKLTGLGAGSAATDSTNLGTVQAGAYANTLADTGAADAYVITPSPAITAYAAGQRFSFIAANASTGASTVNVSALGTKALEYQSVALTGAEIKATSTIVIEYDGTAFQMISPSNLLSATVGDVVGPASATANSLAKFDGTTGKLLKDGAVIGTDVLAPTGDGSGLTGIATGATTAEKTNIMLNAFRISVNGGLAIQQMVDGVVDEFEDQTGVDDAGSTNETYDATGDYYSNLVPVDATVSHTAYDTITGSSPYTHSGIAIGTAGATRKVVVCVAGGRTTAAKRSVSSLTIGGVSAAADITTGTSGNDAHEIWSVDVASGTTGDIVITYGGGAVAQSTIDVFALYNTAASTTATAGIDGGSADPLNATLTVPAGGVAVGQGKTTFTPSTWTNLTEDTDNAQSTAASLASATLQTSLSITCDPTGSLSTDHSMILASWDDGGNSAAADMVLISDSQTANAVPTDAFITIWQADVDAVTVNTDIKAFVSRDGGSTFTQVTLSDEATLTTGRILTGTVDISAQSSGTAMEWKITTHNAKEQRIHAVGLEWA